MKVIAFRVVQRGGHTLSAVVAHAMAHDFQGRLRSIGLSEMRLEHSIEGAAYLSLDFAKIRASGPGRAGRDRAIEDFDLEADEGFGEETAALFHKMSSTLVLQYNHYGPRSGTIIEYLNDFAKNLAGGASHHADGKPAFGFNLVPILQPDARARLARLGLVKSFQLKVQLPRLQSGSPETAQSLGSIFDNQLTAHAEIVCFEVRAGRKKGASLSVERIKDAAYRLLGSKEDVLELKINGKEDEESPSDPLDLIEERLQADIDIDIGTGRRFTAGIRWEALRQTAESWIADRLIE